VLGGRSGRCLFCQGLVEYTLEVECIPSLSRGLGDCLGCSARLPRGGTLGGGGGSAVVRIGTLCVCRCSMGYLWYTVNCCTWAVADALALHSDIPATCARHRQIMRARGCFGAAAVLEPSSCASVCNELQRQGHSVITHSMFLQTFGSELVVVRWRLGAAAREMMETRFNDVECIVVWCRMIVKSEWGHAGVAFDVCRQTWFADRGVR
jgi:hypothetical protein